MNKIVWLVASVLLCAGCTSTPTADEPKKTTSGCHTPLGFIPEGQTASGYLHQVESAGQTCQHGALSCEDGVWTGAYIYPTCVVTP